MNDVPKEYSVLFAQGNMEVEELGFETHECSNIVYIIWNMIAEHKFLIISMD